MISNQSFTADFFAGNRRRLRAAVSEQLIVVTANGLLQRSGDTTFPFRQDSNFWYLTGIDEPDIVLVMEGEKEYLLVPVRSATREAFDGAIDFQTLSALSGIADIMDEETGWQRLGAVVQTASSIALPMAAARYLEQYGFYSNPSRARLAKRIKSYQQSIELVDIRATLAHMRMIKQDAELQALGQAIAITADTLTVLRKELGSYDYEYQIEAAISQGFRMRGATGHAYSPIVASGQNACTLHYVANNGMIDKTGLLLLDVGAEYSQYAADITRTYVVDEPTKRQRDVFDAVCEVQDYAMAALKPGLTIRQYETIVEDFMGKQLRKLKLIKKLDRDTIRHYYPHMTSHFLGLDVHDVGDYERPLEPGMVLTVEPGIYIPEEAIGIRIEDNVVITAGGLDVLSGQLPRDLI